MFLTKNLSSTDALINLPHYLAKCSDCDSGSDLESVKKVVRRLAKLAWSSPRSFNYSGATSDNLETVEQFVMVVLRIRDYKLFNQSVKWLRDNFGCRLFAGVKKAVSEDPSFEFPQVKDRQVLCLDHHYQLHKIPDGKIFYVVSSKPFLSSQRGRVWDFLQTLGVWPYTSPAVSSQIRDWVVDVVVSCHDCLPPSEGQVGVSGRRAAHCRDDLWV